MHFLGFYNIAMALAVVGTCCVSDAAIAHDYYDTGYADDGGYYAVNPYGGGELLPPSRAIVDRPPTMVDGDYNPAYPWNWPYAYTPGPVAMAVPYYDGPAYGAGYAPAYRHAYAHRHHGWHHGHRWHVWSRPAWETEQPQLATWNTDWYTRRHGRYPQP